MDAMGELYGYLSSQRTQGVHMLYMSTDTRLRHPAFGSGYPQNNDEVYFPWKANSSDADYAYNGSFSTWMARHPLAFTTCWHETAHAQQRQDLTFQFHGETEAIPNFLYPYIAVTRFGRSFNQAFNDGHDTSNYSPDQAAMHWMVDSRFREGKLMLYPNDPTNQVRYQPRGWAKYADLARLFGFEPLTAYYHDEHLTREQGIKWQDQRRADNQYYTDVGILPASVQAGDPLPAKFANAEYQGLTVGVAHLTRDSYTYYWTDIRVLKMSLNFGVDLRPLFEFWGTPLFGHSGVKLENKIKEHRLEPSNSIRCLLLRYKTIIPADNAAFRSFMNDVFGAGADARSKGPDDDDRFGIGWFHYHKTRYTPAMAAAAKTRIDNLIKKYYKKIGLTYPCNGTKTGLLTDVGEKNAISTNTNFAWKTNVNQMSPRYKIRLGFTFERLSEATKVYAQLDFGVTFAGTVAANDVDDYKLAVGAAAKTAIAGSITGISTDDVVINSVEIGAASRRRLEEETRRLSITAGTKKITVLYAIILDSNTTATASEVEGMLSNGGTGADTFLSAVKTAFATAVTASSDISVKFTVQTSTAVGEAQSTGADPPDAPPAKKSKDAGLGTGAIVGIIVAVLVVVMGAIGLKVYMVTQKQNAAAAKGECGIASPRPPSTAQAAAPTEKKGGQRFSTDL